MRLIPVVVAASLGAAAAVSAQPYAQHHRPPYRPPYQGHWQVIGTKSVNGGRDSDVISVPGRQRFSQIRLCAANQPLRLRDFSVYFANGGYQQVRTREVINPGTCTRDVSLQGGARNLASVHLAYDRIRAGLIPPRVQVSAR